MWIILQMVLPLMNHFYNIVISLFYTNRIYKVVSAKRGTLHAQRWHKRGSKQIKNKHHLHDTAFTNTICMFAVKAIVKILWHVIFNFEYSLRTLHKSLIKISFILQSDSLFSLKNL